MALDVDHIRQIVDRVAGSSGLEVVETEFRGGGKARMLRVFIDKPGGVTHDDCANFSREVGTILDVEEAVPGGSYTLEVSSPGLDRRLVKAADYERFAGQQIKLVAREPVNGSRHFQGRLLGIADGRVTLDLQSTKSGRKHLKHNRPAENASAELEQAQVTIDLRSIEKANLVPEF
jgi:ribosome maturation factor RimP